MEHGVSTQCPQKNVLLCLTKALQSRTFFWGHCVDRVLGDPQEILETPQFCRKP